MHLTAAETETKNEMGEPLEIDASDIADLRRQLRGMAGSIDDLKGVHAKAARVAQIEAAKRAPRKTDALAASVRSSGQAKDGVIRAGRGQKINYAAAVHYGKKGTPFVDDAVAAKRKQIDQIYDLGLDAVIRRYGLD